MNKEDIIRMARAAGLAYGSDDKPLASVERFAALVAAAEREACAKIVEESCLPDAYSEPVLLDIADDIRARGNT